jgi:hypothetical protein
MPGRLAIDTYDAHAAAAGLALSGRWSTWDGDAWRATDTYAVSVHRRIEHEGGGDRRT